MKTDHLVTLTECVDILDIEYANLQYYKRTKRFLKPKVVISGKDYYDKSEVKKWKMEFKKAGRPKSK